MSVRNWYQRRSTLQQLIIIFLLQFILWFGATFLLDWVNERKTKGVPLQERIAYAWILALIMLFINNWKKIKTLKRRNNG
jgi:hypothetical protein